MAGSTVAVSHSLQHTYALPPRHLDVPQTAGNLQPCTLSHMLHFWLIADLCHLRGAPED